MGIGNAKRFHCFKFAQVVAFVTLEFGKFQPILSFNSSRRKISAAPNERPNKCWHMLAMLRRQQKPRTAKKSYFTTTRTVALSRLRCMIGCERVVVQKLEVQVHPGSSCSFMRRLFCHLTAIATAIRCLGHPCRSLYTDRLKERCVPLWVILAWHHCSSYN